MTNFDKDLFIEWGKAFASALVAFLMLLIACGLFGCKSQKEPMIERHYTTTMQTDSLTRLLSRLVSQQTNMQERFVVMDRERIVYTVNENGDTVGTDRDHEVDRSYTLEKENRELRIENDSLRSVVERKDTVYRDVPYPVEKIKEVEKQLAWWQTALMWMGGAFVALCGYLLYRKFGK